MVGDAADGRLLGLLRVAETLASVTALQTGRGGRVALSPRVLTTLGSISSETWTMMLAPWVLLPLIQGLRGTKPPASAAARAGITQH